MSIPVQRPPLNPQESQVILNELQSEVSVEAAPLLQFILKHAGLIMTALGLFALLLAGGATYRWYTARAATQAQSQLASLTMLPAGQEKFAALENFVSTAPEKVRLAALLELANAALSIQQYDKAADAYAKLYASDATQPLGEIAAINEAQTLMRVGKFDAALVVLEKMQNAVSEENRILVMTILAESAQAAGQTARAITAYEQLAASGTGPEAEFFRFRAQALKSAPSTGK